MALISGDNKIQFECDGKGCKTCTPTHGKNSFWQMLNHAKVDGWIIFKDLNKKKFVHYCTKGCLNASR